MPGCCSLGHIVSALTLPIFGFFLFFACVLSLSVSLSLVCVCYFCRVQYSSLSYNCLTCSLLSLLHLPMSRWPLANVTTAQVTAFTMSTQNTSPLTLFQSYCIILFSCLSWSIPTFEPCLFFLSFSHISVGILVVTP